MPARVTLKLYHGKRLFGSDHRVVPHVSKIGEAVVDMMGRMPDARTVDDEYLHFVDWTDISIEVKRTREI